jgi:thiazole synthase
MLTLYDTQLASRLLVGTARYPSPAIMEQAINASGAEIVTVSLRREAAGGGRGGQFFEIIHSLRLHILPNTAGCHTAKEAVLTARMARDLFATDWVKLEVIGHHDTLQPDVFQLVEAARELAADGFKVFPYMTADLVVAERLVEAGCRVLMPWASPIGSARGLVDPAALMSMRAHFPDVPLIVDAGLGRPSHAAQAMELGYDAVLLNTAVAGAADPVAMARAFAGAITAGREGYLAGLLEPRDMAVPSTPVIGKAVFS